MSHSEKSKIVKQFLFLDTDKRDVLTNGFAMVGSLGIATLWGPVHTMTVETYPTVIR